MQTLSSYTEEYKWIGNYFRKLFEILKLGVFSLTSMDIPRLQNTLDCERNRSRYRRGNILNKSLNLWCGQGLSGGKWLFFHLWIIFQASKMPAVEYISIVNLRKLLWNLFPTLEFTFQGWKMPANRERVSSLLCQVYENLWPASFLVSSVQLGNPFFLSQEKGKYMFEAWNSR